MISLHSENYFSSNFMILVIEGHTILLTSLILIINFRVKLTLRLMQNLIYWSRLRSELITALSALKSLKFQTIVPLQTTQMMHHAAIMKKPEDPIWLIKWNHCKLPRELQKRKDSIFFISCNFTKVNCS